MNIKNNKFVIQIIITLILLFFIIAGNAGLLFAQGRDRGIMRVEFLYAIEHTGGRGEKLRSPTDIHYDRSAEELYIADAGYRKIFIYDKNGSLIDDFTVDDKEGSPTMVSVDGKGRVYVGHNRSPKITIFNFKGVRLDVLDLPGIVDVLANRIRPMYFASSPDGLVYVLKSEGGIVKIDPLGEEHKNLYFSGDDNPNAIFGMTIDPEGRFIFSDMRPYSVVIYDPKEKKNKRFGKAGILYGQLARPSAVTTDNQGHIFVVSLVRNKILCYDREGEFIEEFGGRGKGYGLFYLPSKIVSDGKDRLYVLENALERVQVFRIEFLKEKNKTQSTTGLNVEIKSQKKGGDGKKIQS